MEHHPPSPTRPGRRGTPAAGSPTRRRGPVRALQVLLALAVLVTGMSTGAGIASADPPPVATNVAVERHGTYLRTNFTLDRYLRARVVVGKAPLPSNQTDYWAAGMATSVAGDKYETTYKTNHSISVANLTPGSTYYVQVYAMTGSGLVLVKKNVATSTKHRWVRVKFNKVIIWDDGDPMGCGEIRFSLTRAGGWGSAADYRTGIGSLCSGGSYNYNIVAPWVRRNGASLPATALGIDDDTPFGQLCTAAMLVCGDKASGSVTLGLPNELNDGYTKPFHLFAISDELMFQWLGEYVVTYSD